MGHDVNWRAKPSRILDSRQIQQKGIGEGRLMVSLEATGSAAVPRVHVRLQKEPVLIRLKRPHFGRPLGRLPVLNL